MSNRAATFTSKGLMAFRASSLDAAKELPTRILICAWGETQTNKGLVICNATTAKLVPLNAAKTKRERVALDFQHNSVESSPSYKGEPVKVAAYGSLEIIEGEGIYLSALEWTDEGREHAAGGHYPDISPALKTNDAGEVIWIHSAGLVRQGEMDGLTLFSAGEAEVSSIITQHIDAPNMKNTIQLINLFMAAAGLETIPEDSDLATVTQRTRDAADKLGKERKGLADAVTGYAASIEGLTKRLDAMQKEFILDGATRDGKVVPFDAKAIEGMSVETFAAAVSKLEVGKVPQGGRENPKGSPNQTETFSASDEEVMKTLGIQKDAWQKHNK